MPCKVKIVSNYSSLIEQTKKKFLKFMDIWFWSSMVAISSRGGIRWTFETFEEQKIARPDLSLHSWLIYELMKLY